MKFVILLILLTPLMVFAKIYKWTDANGKVHFSDNPPVNEQSQSIDEQALEGKISSYSYVSVETVPFLEIARPADNSVIMYATEWCKFCAKARKYFAQNNIEYIEKNIDNSAEARKEYESFTGRGVPVIFVGEYRMNGFNADRFDQLYSNRK